MSRNRSKIRSSRSRSSKRSRNNLVTGFCTKAGATCNIQFHKQNRSKSKESHRLHTDVWEVSWTPPLGRSGKIPGVRIGQLVLECNEDIAQQAVQHQTLYSRNIWFYAFCTIQSLPNSLLYGQDSAETVRRPQAEALFQHWGGSPQIWTEGHMGVKKLKSDFMV